MARRWARYGLLLAAGAAGLALGFSFGPNAYASAACSTAGDVSFCAQWGVMGFATRLQVKDTGSQTISSFAFALPSGVTVTGAAGNTGCHAAQPAANDVTCSTPIAPGQQQFVDILSSPTPAVGSTGTLTLSDSAGTPQPAQTLTLDPSAVCGLAAAHIATCTTGTTSTTECHCMHLSVALRDFKVEDNGSKVVFYLDWKLDCAEGNVSRCAGLIDTVGKKSNLRKQALKHHLRLRWQAKNTDDQTFEESGGGFQVTCGLIGNVTGCGSETFTGRAKFELSGRAKARENLKLTWKLLVRCYSHPLQERDQTLRMKFDSHGNLDDKASQLGKL